VKGPLMTVDMTKGEVCLPTAIDDDSARRYIVAFLKANPELLKETAGDAMAVAMWNAFRCATKK
jgi:hypothetical protein